MKTSLAYLKSCAGGCHATVRVTIDAAGRVTTHDVFVDIGSERDAGMSDQDRELLSAILVRGYVIDLSAKKQAFANSDLKTGLDAIAVKDGGKS